MKQSQKPATPEQPRPTCRVCGRLATSRAVDVMQSPDSSYAWMVTKPIGPVTFGCDDHPAVSERFESGRPQ